VSNMLTYFECRKSESLGKICVLLVDFFMRVLSLGVFSVVEDQEVYAKIYGKILDIVKVGLKAYRINIKEFGFNCEID
jgi:hypothetical protein